jgi:pimeloyl-ACP methyl ester carboxylesterase
MRAFATSSVGTRIAHEVHGAGLPALVFMHGWSSDRGYWTRAADPEQTRRAESRLDVRLWPAYRALQPAADTEGKLQRVDA